MQTIPRNRPADEGEAAVPPPAPRRLRALLRRDRRTLSSGRPHPAAAAAARPKFERLLVVTAEQALEEHPERSPRSQVVCCLACGTHYLRPPGRDALRPTGCPRCGYVGWMPAG